MERSPLRAETQRYAAVMAPDPADLQLLQRVARWTGVDFSADMVSQLEVFVGWLGSEATRAGGIGPDESQRLWTRHVGDSLVFARAIKGFRSVLDVGSGVGLPGIPLAIVLPNASFTLLDRSERRCRLARRAIRITEIKNVEVIQGDARSARCDVEAVVSRAALPIDELIDVSRRIAQRGRTLVAAASHGMAKPASAPDREAVEVPAGVFGHRVWLIRVPLIAAEPS